MKRAKNYRITLSITIGRNSFNCNRDTMTRSARFGYFVKCIIYQEKDNVWMCSFITFVIENVYVCTKISRNFRGMKVLKLSLSLFISVFQFSLSIPPTCFFGIYLFFFLNLLSLQCTHYIPYLYGVVKYCAQPFNHTKLPTTTTTTKTLLS